MSDSITLSIYVYYKSASKHLYLSVHAVFILCVSLRYSKNILIEKEATAEEISTSEKKNEHKSFNFMYIFCLTLHRIIIFNQLRYYQMCTKHKLKRRNFSIFVPKAPIDFTMHKKQLDFLKDFLRFCHSNS